MTCHVLGIDTSTTATKALLMDESGRVVAVAASEYGYETPHPLWSEQSPKLWWRAAVDAIGRALAESGVRPESIRAVGLTGQMHGLVLLDRLGRVLRPAILWNDQRTQAQCNQIRGRVGRERLIQIAGNDALTGFTAPKILWVQQNEPEVYEQIAQILLPKDSVRYRLTGEFASDKADAAGTLLFDLRARDWSPELLRALEIDPAWLPPTFEGTTITGRISRAAAEATGLAAGTPVVAGGGDQAAAAIGAGAVRQGMVSLSLGTSGVVFAPTDRPVIELEGRLHAFCHAAPGRWHLMGVMLSAAGSLRWYRDTLAPAESYDALLAPAGEIAPGSDGLLFLPYLTGERTPHPDPLARGAWVGLTVRHTRAHLTRALLEGVAFGLRDSLELMRGLGLAQVDQVRITGGGARSPLWRQILADVLGAELVTVNAEEGAAYGAALLAAVGAELFPDVETACAATIQETGRTTPGADASAYQEIYPLYRSLYPALRGVFNQTAG